MAHYIMERPLLLLCLLAVIHSGSSLKCISCKGTKDCKGNEVTCTGKNDRCSTSVLSISSFFYSNHRIIKSCSNTTGPSKYTVLSTDRMANLSLQEIYCDSDLCNNQGIFNSAPIVNGLNCYGCISTGKECNSRVRTQLQCTGDQNQCVDIGIIGTFGSTGDTSLKGCGQITACSEDLRYSSQNASVRVQCCDGNFCNDAIEMTKEDKTPNGISCFSCESVNGRGCSPEEVSTVQCHGPLTSCMEVAGIKNQDGNPMPHVIKGCATPAMCNSSVVTLLQNLDRATVQCCSGNLCNNKVTEASLQKDGLPSSETVPPNTDFQCFTCEGSWKSGCLNPTLKSCGPASNVCTETITIIKAGNQSVEMIQKDCGSGSPTNIQYSKNYEGLQIRSFKKSCNSSKCNNVTSALPPDSGATDSPSIGTVECYSCISPNKSLCNPEKVNCPKDESTCYDGTALVVNGNLQQTLYVKQCTNGSSPLPLVAQWLNITLNSDTCSYSLCNKLSESTTSKEVSSVNPSAETSISSPTATSNDMSSVVPTTNGVLYVARPCCAFFFLTILLLSMFS